MSGGFFNTFFTEPLYNGLIFLMDALPWVDAGVVIVLFTVVVKLILFPLSRKAIHTQVRMKEIEPELKSIKEKYKNDKQKQAMATMDLYRMNHVNPFSSFLLILIQIPIIFALYKIFLSGGLPSINTEALYSFIPSPETVDTKFLGLLEITKKSVILALAAGVSQYFQAKFSIPALPPKNSAGKPSFQEDLARGMPLQMRYILPVITFVISYSISGAVALYWTTSNVFAIVQELYVRGRLKSRTTPKGPDLAKS